MSSEFAAAKDFAKWTTRWDEIHGAMPDVAPFLESRFLQPLLTHFGTGREVVLFGGPGSKPFFAAIIQRAPGVWSTFQPSQLPLGPVVARPGTTWSEIQSALKAALPWHVVSLGVTQMDPSLLERPRGQESFDFYETAWVDVAGSFDDYWAARGKNLRHNMRKQRSRLAEAGIGTRLECITDPAGIRGAIDDYGRLEAAGWKGELGTAVRADNAQGSFYQAMLEAYMQTGKARIWRFWFDSKPVAIDLCIESESTLVVLKTTYDESQTQYSPALLMREGYFRNLFDEGRIRRIEFYGRRMEWHKRWTDNVRVLYHTNYDRWPVATRLRRLRGSRRDSPAGANAAGEPA